MGLVKFTNIIMYTIQKKRYFGLLYLAEALHTITLLREKQIKIYQSFTLSYSNKAWEANKNLALILSSMLFFYFVVINPLCC